MTADLPRVGNPFDALASTLAAINEHLDLDDAAFYRDLAARHGRPVVELGVGDGRVARVVRPDAGVDSSSEALALCRAAAPGVDLVEADLADYALERPAAFSYAPLNTFNHVVDDEHRSAALRNVWRNTVPGGVLALDVALPDRAKLVARDGIPVQRFHFDRLLIEDVTEVVDLEGGLVHIHIREERLDGDGTVLSRTIKPVLPFRFLTPARFERQLEDAGWDVASASSGFDGAPLAPGSRTAVYVLKRRDR